MAKKEAMPPEVWMIATLKEMLVEQTKTRRELEAIRKNQANNTLHIKYELDLSVAHTNHELADFVKMGVEINAIIVMPVPSALTLKLGGVAEEPIDLAIKETLNLTGQFIPRLLATNVAGTGTAEIHVFGR